MEGELLKIAMSQRIWSVLSIFLIIYILKIQEKRDINQYEREKNYFNLINELTDKLNIVKDINNDIEYISKKIKK